MKLTLFLIVLVVLAVFAPWRDWFMALRIRSAKKSLREGREVLAALQASIADLKAKMGQDGKYACLDPVLKSLEAQERNLAVGVERFAVNIQFIEELRQVVNAKKQKPADVDTTLEKLKEFNDPKLDQFLRELNGDK